MPALRAAFSSCFCSARFFWFSSRRFFSCLKFGGLANGLSGSEMEWGRQCKSARASSVGYCIPHGVAPQCTAACRLND